MDEKDVQALIDKTLAPVNEKLTAVEKERDEFKAAAEKLEADEKTRVAAERKTKLETATKRVDAIFNQAIEAEVILPAKREEFTAAFDLGNEDKLAAMEDADFKRIEAIVNPEGKKKTTEDKTKSRYFTRTDETGKEQKVNLPSDSTDGNLVLMTDHYLAEHPNFMADSPERYERALEYVMRQNPELTQAYVTGNGVAA